MKFVRAQLRPLLLILAVAGALTACSDRSSPPSVSVAPQSQWLAMARGQIDVEGGLIRVVTARDGVVDSVKVEDGDTVQQGQVLVTLDQSQAKISLGIAEANLAQAEAQVAVAKTRLPQAQSQAQRVGEASVAGAATGQAADEATAVLAQLKAQVGAAEASVRVAREHVQQARAELDARVIKAPASGRIVRRMVHVGDAVSAQSATELFQLLPDRPRIVRAELDEAYVDLIKPGMQAEVVRDSGDGKAVTARVLRIGEVFGPSRLADDPVERAGARDVECVLQIDGGDFRIGQRVMVRFPREKQG